MRPTPPWLDTPKKVVVSTSKTISGFGEDRQPITDAYPPARPRRCDIKRLTAAAIPAAYPPLISLGAYNG
ncbi:hypothetical protein AVDCRST_MAG94-1031 [uncultured Leptolyngbya sp.]|uniref:Uncharacterized protein n=1 Tax=uncultured Leptolyngbya sp. TaxID=332963 RepID=A0A6J4KRF8_9CYAN|nr:hypothetical protein AVDCRST_MAG94-1031 [uncultured Leptolyngbya sp.]